MNIITFCYFTRRRLENAVEVKVKVKKSPAETRVRSHDRLLLNDVADRELSTCRTKGLTPRCITTVLRTICVCLLTAVPTATQAATRIEQKYISNKREQVAGCLDTHCTAMDYGTKTISIKYLEI